MQYTLNHFNEWEFIHYDDERTDSFDMDVPVAIIG